MGSIIKELYKMQDEKYRNIYFPDLNLDLKEVIDVIKFNKKGFITRTDIILYILYLLNE